MAEQEERIPATREDVLEQLRITMDGIKIPGAMEAKETDVLGIDLDVDSLDYVEIANVLEDFFALGKIPDDTVKNLAGGKATVGFLIDIVMKLEPTKPTEPPAAEAA